MEQNLIKYEKDLQVMRTEREETESDGQQLLKCIEEITDQLNEDQNAYVDIKKEVVELTKRAHKLESDKIELDETLKTFNNAINDCKAQIHQWKAKVIVCSVYFHFFKLRILSGFVEFPSEIKQHTRRNCRRIKNVQSRGIE